MRSNPFNTLEVFMKKLIFVLSIAIAAMSMSSCIVLRDIQDTDYTYSEPAKKQKPNRPGNTTKSTTPKNNTTKKAKPNRP